MTIPIDQSGVNLPPVNCSHAPSETTAKAMVVGTGRIGGENTNHAKRAKARTGGRYTTFDIMILYLCISLSSHAAACRRCEKRLDMLIDCFLIH